MLYIRKKGGAGVDVQDFADYEGRYLSEELDVQYVVLLKNDRLRVKLPRGNEVPCVRVHDELFRCPNFTMEFDRDDRSLVTAFRVSTERSQDVRFRKH